LEFSQLQKASDLGKKDTVKISGFINSLNKAFISYAQQQFMNNTRLKIEVSEKLKEASIHIYYTRFLSVTKAILENAVKFGKDGPVILSLDNVKENDLLISVRDHGIGLAEKEGHIVFQDFRQMDSGHDRKYDGIGMGLAMSNKIMEFMNGSIWYKKNEGLGTTFFIHLPNCLQ